MDQVRVYCLNGLQYMNKIGCLILGILWMQFCCVVSTNIVILNHSCGDIKVEASYVKSLHKTRTMKQSHYILNCIKLTISVIDNLG